jgi:putative DNA primase/helicase
MCLDIDNWDLAKAELAEHSIDLDALYTAADAVTIESGRQGHGKLVYAMPFGLVLPSKKLIAVTNGMKTNYLDFRCATKDNLTVQDVLPSSIHPETQQPYRWGGRGHWSRLPPIPGDLLGFWYRLVEQDQQRNIPTQTDYDTSWDEIRTALTFISPDIDRDQWVSVGMAIHFAGTATDQLQQAFALWDEWSSGSVEGKYQGTKDLWSAWRSFKANGGITLGTLLGLAKEGGWRRPVPSAQEIFDGVPTAEDAGTQISDSERRTKGHLRTTIAADVKPRVLKWIWQGVLPKGKVVTVAGDPGVGKGVLTAKIAAHVSTGRDWIPGQPCDRGTVAFLAHEDAKDDTVVPRLMAAGADLTRVAFIEGVTVPNAEGDIPFNLEESAPLLDQWLTDHSDVTVVIIDPINDFLGPNTDSYKDAEVRQILNPLKIMAERHGVTMVMVSHMNKGSGKADYRIMGAMAFTGVARITMLVVKDQHDPVRRLILPVKANITKDTTGYSYRIQEALVPIEEDDTLTWVGHPVAMLDHEQHGLTANEVLQQTTSSLNDEIEEFLQTELANGPVPAAEMDFRCAGAGLSYATVNKRKKLFGVKSRKEKPGDPQSPWVWELSNPAGTPVTNQKDQDLPDEIH